MDSALQEITERVRAAAADGTLLRIRGGGSKDFYGQALQGEVLDTRALRGIVSYEPSELVVTVRAGTPLAELEAVLAERGQMLPFEPPHFPDAEGASLATCGGMIAAGLNGPARAASGAVRDYVLGLTALNGRAEELTFGGQVMKNVAGYDVSRLMAGSLGTLGLITEVSIKVLPIAPAQATLVFEADEDKALAMLNRWGGQPLPINASCWHAGALMVRLRGAVAAVASANRSMGGQPMDDSQAAQLWTALREHNGPFFALQSHEALVRMSVPDTAPALHLGHTLIEWGGAQRWIKVPAAQLASIRTQLATLGGHATLMRGADKGVGVFTPLTAPLDRIHRDLKREFDPAGIFNRGRMYADF